MWSRLAYRVPERHHFVTIDRSCNNGFELVGRHSRYNLSKPKGFEVDKIA